MSIRRRLLLILLSVICGLWGIVTWRVYIDTQHEVEELFDANLAQSAKVLLGLVQHEIEQDGGNRNDDEGIELEEDRLAHRYEHKLAFLVRAIDGHLIVRSSSAPLFPKPDPCRLAYYSDYQIGGFWWRVFTLKSGHFFVQTGERYDIREELISEILSSTLTILPMALPLLAVLIWISVGHSFRPLQQVAADIASRTPDQLQPLVISKIPLEINVLVKALNQLFIRLTNAFENERRFTADAAHELRTPLAGIKTQAQVAMRASDARQRQQALQQIWIGVDRATHLVAQLLALARMEATQTLHQYPVDLEELVSRVIVDLMPQALDKGIDLGLEKTATTVTTLGNEEALYLMIRNLVDNAIRYTPTGGQVTVSLHNPKSPPLRLTISDTGPGIPPEQRVLIFERFYRGDNQNIPGSGLGLSIAQQVAQLHNIEIQLDKVRGSGGLSVQLDFS
jgi:two-component system sensor histidine kinase QseC